MEVLQPYLDSGKLACPSGQTDKFQIAIPGWSSEAAQERMENLITSNNYSPTGTPLHAVMCLNDSLAQGVTNALVNAGFTGGEGFPTITGQDCDIVSVRNIIAGTQAMSSFKDTRTLVNKTVEMVNAIIAGEEPPINDRETYDNNKGIVPAFLCGPVVVTIENYEDVLIGSGYCTKEDILAD
jgi:putative multiple sugar transport system substrate-binding protein